MKLNLHFLEAEGSLAGWRDQLGEEATVLVEQIDSIVPARLHGHAVDVVIQYLPQDCVEGLAMGGSCYRRGMVSIALDPDAECFSHNFERGFFRRTLAHELHHSMRWNSCGYGMRLGEALVSEGLADIFSELVSGTETPAWSNALETDEWPMLLERAEREIDSESYDHGEWFFGTGELPRWAGYTLGYHLACHYAHKNPKAVATGLVDVPAEAVVARWNEMKAAVAASQG
ncbi:MAG: hypothetical protein JNM45_05655 [Rhizobiales bacterium]|nr:hypothetical protein [Hyphomicrobiales bacterium]